MTVLILGAGVMQIPAIRIAREKGWRVAAADGNPAAAGAELADIFYPVDLKDLEGLEKAARGLAADGGLDAVFTAGTDFSYSVAWLAQKLELPGISPEAALRASNKLEMRAALAAAGVPSPKFTALGPDMDIGAALHLAGLGLPLVVKPADSMGARGCSIARSMDELSAAAADAIRYSRVRRAIVEEYMDGPEFSIDALVDDGKIQICGFADRHIYFAPYFVELGHTMPSAYSSSLRAKVIKVFEAGVRAIGITRGAAKGDMKWCPARGTAMVGEIAARLSGGYMSGWTYPYASGIEVTSAALDLAAGGHLPAMAGADRGWVSAERAFISIPGRAAAILGGRAAENAPYIKNVFYRVAPGGSCVFPLNNVQKCGNVISQAPERRLAVEAAEKAVADIVIRLEPRVDETDSFLRGEGRIQNPDGSFWPPDAFSLPPQKRRAIEVLGKAEGCGDSLVRKVLEAARRGTDGPYAALPRPLPVISSKALWGIDPDTAKLIDWSGRSLAASAGEAVKRAGACFADELSGSAELREISAAFWLCIIRGGIQGGIYLLDSISGGTAQ